MLGDTSSFGTQQTRVMWRLALPLLLLFSCLSVNLGASLLMTMESTKELCMCVGALSSDVESQPATVCESGSQFNGYECITRRRKSLAEVRFDFALETWIERLEGTNQSLITYHPTPVLNYN